MSKLLSEICSVDKAIIGGVHFLPLPGTPDYDEVGGMGKIYRRAWQDAMTLQEGGVDAILFANEADCPYQTHVGTEIVAAMTYCISRMKSDLKVPYGINMLIDPIAGVSVAHATGAKFVRGYFTGAYVGDMGILNTSAAEATRTRRRLGSSVKLYANLTCAFGVPMVQRDLVSATRGALAHACVDGLIVSGPQAGAEADVADLLEVRKAAKEVPLLIGTGVNIDNAKTMLKIADGAIVASHLKVDGVTLNPVDKERVHRFMEMVKEIRREVKDRS